MTRRYRIVDDEGTEVGALVLGDGIPVGPDLANERQFAAFGGKGRHLAQLLGLTLPDITEQAKSAVAAEFGLDEDASRKTWTWAQMHWCLTWMQDRIDMIEAKAPVAAE